MKKNIRRGVFETNSSSIHCITINTGTGRRGAERYLAYHPKQIEVRGGCFGWEVENYTDPSEKLSYAFTLAQSGYWDQYEKRLQFMEKTLRDAGFDPVFQEMVKTERKYTNVDHETVVHYYAEPANGDFIYIDHSGNFTVGFTERLFTDEEFFLDFAFGESEIATGNDNDEADHPMPVMDGDYYTDKGN